MRAKAAKSIKVGDGLEIRKPPYRYQIQIRSLAARRLSATLAQQLYEETAESQATRQRLREQLQAQPKVQRRLIDGKPSKRDQRELRKLRQI